MRSLDRVLESCGTLFGKDATELMQLSMPLPQQELAYFSPLLRRDIHKELAESLTTFIQEKELFGIEFTKLAEGTKK